MTTSADSRLPKLLVKFIGEALDRVLGEPGTRTRDLGGPLGTAAFAAAVVNAIG